MLTEENKKYKENKTEPKANHLNFSNKHFRLFFPTNFLKVSFVFSIITSLSVSFFHYPFSCAPVHGVAKSQTRLSN